MTTEARFIHCTFLKVRSVLKQTSLIPGDTTLSWQQGETLSNTIYFWFLWRFIYSNSHPKFLSFLEFLSEKWWLLLFFVKLTLLNEMKWSIWSYSVSNLLTFQIYRLVFFRQCSACMLWLWRISITISLSLIYAYNICQEACRSLSCCLYFYLSPVQSVYVRFSQTSTFIQIHDFK